MEQRRDKPSHDPLFLNKLKREIEEWLREGLIDEPLKDRLLSRYRFIEDTGQRAVPSRLITTLSVLGAILAGLGVILFVASNWSLISRWGKIAILYSSLILTYGCGYYLGYERQNYPKTGAALIFAGSFVFGAGLFLISQIYHISLHYPNGVLAWSLAVMPVAYLLRLRTLLSLSIVVLLVWFGMEASFQVIEDERVYMHYIFLYFMAGITLWSIGLMHRDFLSLKTFSGPYIITGVVVTFLSWFILTFTDAWQNSGQNELLIFFIVITGLFLLSIAFRSLAGDNERLWLIESISLFILIAIVFYLSVSAGNFSGSSLRIYVILSNILFLIVTLGVMILGYIRRYPAYINTGLLFFVLFVFARYFDIFWEMLPRSLFFITGVLLLLIGGFMLERKRRKVIRQFKEGTDAV